MRAFQFKLERLLSLRKYRERELEIRLAEATGRCVRFTREIEERNVRKVQSLGTALRGDTVEEYLDIHRYIKRLDQEIERKSAELTAAEQTRKEIQADYLEASRERKVLDNLKTKREAEYRKAQKVEDVKQIDDINTGRAARVRPAAELES